MEVRRLVSWELAGWRRVTLHSERCEWLPAVLITHVEETEHATQFSLIQMANFVESLRRCHFENI